MTHKLTMIPSINSKGEALSIHCSVLYKGRVIVERTIQPLLDACRVLQRMGLKGRAELWDNTRTFHRIAGDIDKCAALTVSEGDRYGPVFARYQPIDPAKLAKLRAATS